MQQTLEQETRRKKHREYMRAWRRTRGKDYYLAARVWRDYRLRLDDYRAMLGAGCAICGAPATGIDHCHTNGHVRGALCNGCNTGLGMFEDDIDRLRAAIAYLENRGRLP